MKEAAAIYTELMLELHKSEFARKDFKSQVVTAGDPMGKPKDGEKQKVWRGKVGVLHLEGFAITDKKMVAFLKTPRGKAKYRQILNQSFGGIHGITLGLPHSATDIGAEDKETKDNEVSLARYLLGDTQPEVIEPSQPTQVAQVDEPKNYKLKPARIPYTPSKD